MNSAVSGTTIQYSKERRVQYGRAAVSTSQPLATEAGIRILEKGGNAADAAVAAAAMLAVTEPPSNGIGGDFIALHHNGRTHKTEAILGIGRSPQALTLDLFCSQPSSRTSPHVTTVPGAVAAWDDMYTHFGSGKISFAELIAPAVAAAKNGHFVHHTTAAIWSSEATFLTEFGSTETPFLPAPAPGALFQNADLARVLEKIGMEGRDGFYKGEVAEAIIAALSERGAAMSQNDLAMHETVMTNPIATTYRGWKVEEVGAPTHGAVTLLALNILEQFQVSDMTREEIVHLMVEAIRQSFWEASKCVADGGISERDVQKLTEKWFGKSVAARVKLSQKSPLGEGGGSLPKGGTVQFCVVDHEGNAVSAVQSNYLGFGTGIVPKKCGFSLQCRGLNFSRFAWHANCAGGGKRPYHTIIPGMMTREPEDMNGEHDVVAFGVMGSFMQPQGHVLIVNAMVDAGKDAQEALDLERFRVTGTFSAVEEGMSIDRVLVESDMPENVVRVLEQKGHAVMRMKINDMPLFGRGHVCAWRSSNGRVEAAADSRADGFAGVCL